MSSEDEHKLIDVKFMPSIIEIKTPVSSWSIKVLLLILLIIVAIIVGYFAWKMTTQDKLAGNANVAKVNAAKPNVAKPNVAKLNVVPKP